MGSLTQTTSQGVAADSVTVLICAYTQARWSQLEAAVQSTLKQTHPADEVIVIIDHNSELLARARTAFQNATVIANTGTRGLSGARNSGVAAARSSVIAFLDDDAVADADWLEQLMLGYQVAPGAPQVLGVGGTAYPLWPAQAPRWFPDAFLWVVGCSHSGLPRSSAPVRNFIGCNMSFRRAALAAVGDFRTALGRVGSYPAGCEETELCIRLKQHDPEGLLLYRPEARVGHHVSRDRLTLRYYMSRCYAEGRSKAVLSRFVGSRDGLASERAYTLRVLPWEVLQGVRDALLKRELAGLGRAGSVVLGLVVTAAGYAVGCATQALSPVDRSLEFSPFEPIRVLELDLAAPLPDLSALDPAMGQRYTRALALVRLQADPLGLVELKLGMSAGTLATCIWDELGPTLQRRFPEAALELTADGLHGVPSAPQLVPDDAPLVSVIIATHDRAQSLAACLASLEQLTYPNFEVVIVDNVPSTSETRELVQGLVQRNTLKDLHYVRENAPGLAVAHNRGLLEARGDIVAFTDDDVRVDRYWLSKLVEGFQAAPRVGCVTGMITPAELETPAQAWLEQYGGFSKGFELRVFNLDEHRLESPLYPYTAGVFGSGANMAFTREALTELGGFDPALGAGSKGVGGDDLAAFFDVVTRGYTLVYQPAALVHHWHRRDYLGLKRTAYGYGVGLTAFLTKVILDAPQRLFQVVPLVPRALRYALSPNSPKNAKKRTDYPKELSCLERQGMLYGPVAYLRSRWHLRRPSTFQPKRAVVKS